MATADQLLESSEDCEPNTNYLFFNRLVNNTDNIMMKNRTIIAKFSQKIKLYTIKHKYLQ